MDQNIDVLTGQTLPEGVDVAPADGAPAASDVAPAAADAPSATAANQMSLEELNKFLGKNFPTKEAALKSIQDTYKYVGTAGKNPVDQSALEKKLSDEIFFIKNPQYESHRELAEAIAAKQGISVTDAVQTDSFKTYFEKATGYDDSLKAKSVLHSNPRLGAVKDSLSSAQALKQKADDALRSGDPSTAARLDDEGRRLAVAAVVDLMKGE